MPTVTIKMNAAQYAVLDRAARDRGTSKAQILREAFLREQATEAPGSAYDLIADLVGSVRGPADLSTNPEYLDNYGRPRDTRRK